jgi:hypothetical protein
VSNKAEGMLTIFAALLVLFTAMLDPLTSAGIAVVALAGLGVYHITKRR